MGKSGKVTPPSENFLHKDRHRRFLPSLLNVQIRAFWKPLSKIFSNCFARVSTAIDCSRESCRHHLLSAAVYCPLAFYVKIEAKWHHLQKNFFTRPISVVYHSLPKSSSAGSLLPVFSPPYLHGENHHFWKHLSKKFRRHEARAENCPTLLHVKIRAKWHRQNQIL